MKTPEQVFTEWVSDAIEFGVGGKKFTREGFKELCEGFRRLQFRGINTDLSLDSDFALVVRKFYDEVDKYEVHVRADLYHGVNRLISPDILMWFQRPSDAAVILRSLLKRFEENDDAFLDFHPTENPNPAPKFHFLI